MSYVMTGSERQVSRDRGQHPLGAGGADPFSAS